MRIELLISPQCPNAVAAKQTIIDCLAALGIDVPIIERVGHYLSPTILIDGVDVMHPHSSAAPTGDGCRLDIPRPQRVLGALIDHQPWTEGDPP